MGILSPFLSLPPLYAVIIVAFLVSLAINIAYKYLTDQKLMKKLKDEISDIQKKSKELPPEKALSLQKKALEINMEYLKHSLKPTLFTMLPVLLVFMWMSAHYAFVPLYSEKEFSTTVKTTTIGTITILAQEGIEIIGEKSYKLNQDNATFTMKGKSGNYLIEYDIEGKKYNHEVTIANEQTYSPREKKINDGTVTEIIINYQKNELMDLFGWKVGWLGTYIIFSIVFSLALRKAMNLY